MSDIQQGLRRTGPTDDKVVVEYLKGTHFRVIHADGGIGGPTPSGNIHLAIFSERPAIPRRLVARLQDGLIGEIIPEESVVRDGMVREMDVDIVMSVSVAEAISKLLARMALDAREVTERVTQGRGTPK